MLRFNRHCHPHRRDYADWRLNSSDSSSSSPAELKTLPKFKSRPGSTELCAICLENYADGDWCRQLPDCKHSFHSNCVDRWLAKSPGCPVCRTAVRLSCAGRTTTPPESMIQVLDCGTPLASDKD